MLIQLLQSLRSPNKLDDVTVQRIGDVLTVAVMNEDFGVADWAVRAISDGNALGRLRSRDAETLKRLEGTYAHDFYRTDDGGTAFA